MAVHVLQALEHLENLPLLRPGLEEQASMLMRATRLRRISKESLFSGALGEGNFCLVDYFPPGSQAF